VPSLIVKPCQYPRYGKHGRGRSRNNHGCRILSKSHSRISNIHLDCTGTSWRNPFEDIIFPNRQKPKKEELYKLTVLLALALYITYLTAGIDVYCTQGEEDQFWHRQLAMKPWDKVSFHDLGLLLFVAVLKLFEAVSCEDFPISKAVSATDAFYIRFWTNKPINTFHKDLMIWQLLIKSCVILNNGRPWEIMVDNFCM